MEKIKIPFVVTRDERAQIKEAYLSGIKSADAEKVSYIVDNLPKVLRRLKKSDEPWHVEIADVAERFKSLLHSGSGVTKSGRRELVAALYYLCHPFEVIPDYVPGRGYADDALVLNTCMSRLRQRGVKLEMPTADQPLLESLEQQAE